MLSLLGSLLGFGTSFLPSILNFFKEKRDQSHELAMMDKQLEQQIAIGAQKLQMTHVDADIRESEALLKHDAKLNEKASRWVVNMSASVRPVMTYLFFVEFFALSAAVFFDVISKEEYNQIWNDPTQALFATVVSFWFGSRTFNRANHT
jgi:hypothetical protein